MNIQNHRLSLTLTLKAAEMTSLIDKKTGQELLWQGDPAFWAGRNPILFPIVGSTFDKKIHLFGKEYVMGNHGFARNSEFDLVSHTDNAITLVLKDNETTLAQYPFHFTLTVTSTLKENTVLIDYTIVNLDEKKMPFSFGLHPAFAIENPDSARIAFPQAENHPLLMDKQPIVMDDAFFQQHSTFLLENLKSTFVDLVRKDQTIRVGIQGYRWLAFWKKPGAKFICIEPWHGHTDHQNDITDFYQREGTIVLNPGETWTTSYTVSVV